MPHPSKFLKDIRPELASEWLAELNAPRRFESVAAFSNKTAWWQCSKNNAHKWEAKIASRSGGTNCPYCRGLKVDETNSLLSLKPDVAAEWHETRNVLTPAEVTIHSGKKVWWKCQNVSSHIWQATVNDRTRGFNCPFCSGRNADESNSLEVTSIGLLKEWDYEKNRLPPNRFKAYSNKKVWWVCEQNHSWEARIYSRTTGSGCPICSGKVVSELNALSTQVPELLKFWDYERNGELQPESVSYGSSSKIWLKCPKGEDHVWQNTAANFSKSKSCPFCLGQRVSITNCLHTVYPDIALEWHPEMNGKLTPKSVTPGSTKHVWWRCSTNNEHVWNARIDHRQNAGCPICSNRVIDASNNLTVTDPLLAKEWNLDLNWPLKPDEFSSGSDKKVWWTCRRNAEHVWESRIYSRRKSGCPHCKLVLQSRIELSLLFELKWVFTEINPKGAKLKAGNGKLLAVDIYIRELNLAIEYDGAFWHKSRVRKDLEKSLLLKDSGISLIRVRESPLEELFKDDIRVNPNESVKIIANKVFQAILGNSTVSQSQKLLIKSYLASNELKMRDKLEAFIDSKLTIG